MRGYPQWPDAAVVNKSWLRCRTDKHYIEGSVKQGFSLTPKGLKAAEHVQQRLFGESTNHSTTEIKTEVRTKAGSFLTSLEKSRVYAYYKQTGNIEKLEDYDLTDML